MDRREFLKQSASAGGVVIIATLVGCGDSGKDSGDSGGSGTGTGTGTGTGGGTGSGTGTGTGAGTGTGTGTGAGSATGTGTGTGGGCAANDASGGDNEAHGHILVIPAADWAAGNPGNYMSTGGNHDHTVPISAQNMADLAANCQVQVSSNDTHAHTWNLVIA